jgi:hypothetical protein
MQQRQLRLGDILDDYCPRERRLTNHAVVAMIDGDVKQTRCTTCDAEHEYKHARVPRQRRKADTPPALYAQVAAGAPKRVPHDEPNENAQDFDEPAIEPASELPEAAAQEAPAQDVAPANEESAIAASVEDTSEEPPDDLPDEGEDPEREEGPVHRPLIRASLPRPDGQAPPARPAPDFTIRQPGGRPNRFRPRHQRGGQPFQGQGNRSSGNFGGPHRGRPPQNAMSPRGGRRHGPQGRKRSK